MALRPAGLLLALLSLAGPGEGGSRGQAAQELRIRDLISSPDRYVGREVRVAGRFRGRTAEDTPAILAPLNRTRWDFVLQATDGAVWISGMQPRGDDFSLDPLSARDAGSGQWLAVTGRVQVDDLRGCAPRERCRRVWIAASRIELSRPRDRAFEIVRVPSIAEPPPQVVFSVPVPNDTDVPRGTAVRVQFSQDMLSTSFADRVRASYASERDASIPLRAKYDEGTRALTIEFADALAPLQDVTVQLGEGITARDGQPLRAWTLQFTTGR